MEGDEIEDVSETEGVAEASPNDPDTFPRSYVEELRRESKSHRERSVDAESRADGYARRLHTALVDATGQLASPADLPFDAAHLDDADALNAAIEALLTDKPYLKARRVSGDVGQGVKGERSEQFSLIGALKNLI